MTRSDDVDLPGISRLSYHREAGRTTATCWFETGAQLRYREREDGSLIEEVFRADDPDSVYEKVVVGHPDDHDDMTACACLVESLDVYHDFRHDDSQALRGDWSTLAAVLVDASSGEER